MNISQGKRPRVSRNWFDGIVRRCLAGGVVFVTLTMTGCTARQGISAQCTFNDECEPGLVCAGRFCRVPCRTNRDCPSGQCKPSDQPDALVCLYWGSPLLCARNSDCPEGTRCGTDKLCRVPCGQNGECPQGGACNTTSGLCVVLPTIGGPPEPLQDAGVVDGTVRQDAGCDASVTNDPSNCGQCGHACARVPHSSVSCEQGQCITQCATGFASCDGNPDNGCESEVAQDPMNCGVCGRTCSVDGQLCLDGRCTAIRYPSTGDEGDLALAAGEVRMLSAGTHQFGTISIAAGATLRVGNPGILDLRAQGAVVIAGTIDLSGGAGGAGSDNTVGNGGGTGNTLSGASASASLCVGTVNGGAGLGGFRGGPTCGEGGFFGGGSGGAPLSSAGGGGGFAGGGGGACAAGLGGNGGATPGNRAGLAGTAALPAGRGAEASANVVYAGKAGVATLNGGGGGGSIGAEAVADIDVRTTFRPGSGGGGGGGGPAMGAGGAGGGGGGGALRIASTVRIEIAATGQLLARGGDGGPTLDAGGGGGGSGGVIDITAPAVSVQGTISAAGGSGGIATTAGTAMGGAGGNGGMGRVRISTTPTRCVLTGTIVPPASPSCALTTTFVAGNTVVRLYPL